MDVDESTLDAIDDQGHSIMIVASATTSGMSDDPSASLSALSGVLERGWDDSLARRGPSVSPVAPRRGRRWSSTGAISRRSVDWTWTVAAFGVVLLVVLGLAAFAVVILVTSQPARDPSRGPSAAELTRARRRADVQAFREAELEELRTMGHLVDREILEGA